ncbi:MAG: MBOAT family protein [Candidatus Auribacter fodinae]|uniref:MBOAT family protein n=1 Tax=Candidatus Auribacter fodinae TaxID=2093366 RepID=A0A3A4QUY1_9BACT|nr:MAG: MBOAT family protein [Candidatus Auribacter fodinae]
MVFSSPIFLFLYLPVFLVVYYLLFFPVKFLKRQGLKNFFRHTCNTFILLASILFYCWGEKILVLVMLLSTVIDYCCGLLISRADAVHLVDQHKKKKFLQKSGLIISISCNLLILAFFKYFNFGMDNYNTVMGMFGLSSLQIQNVLKVTLPLGISFYTFQSMSYTIDVYRGNVKATTNFLDFACFVTMFPQLVAGPIVRYKDLAEQIIERTITAHHIVYGIQRFIVGLGKKVIIANTVAATADAIFAIPGNYMTSGLAWLGILSYTLQIYFDFSGYSDMAIGLGSLLGFTFPENFNHPYRSQSVQEFWRRWHISLSSWFRDYLYIPLGGSQCSLFRTYFNLVIVFTLCGLWHGASWTFVVWGLFHGCFLVLERLGLLKWINQRPVPIRHMYVMSVAICGWVLFRAETFTQAIVFFQSMAGFAPGDGSLYSINAYLNGECLIALMIGSLLSVPVVPWLSRTVHSLAESDMSWLVKKLFSGVELAVMIGIMILCYLSLSSGTYNPFIYFRF